MEFKWLDDLVALAEEETLTRAAARRNVTQPAFSRRVQRIEQWLGAPVLDRSRRPARLSPALRRKIESIRALNHELRQVRSDIRNWDESQRRLAIAAQHSISVSFLPRFVASLQDSIPLTSIRLRSGNREECYSLLMTRQVAITIAHETDTLPLAANETLLEKVKLGEEWLCPVAAPAIASGVSGKGIHGTHLPAILFPPEVFLGAVLARDVLPAIRERHVLQVACESALVPAVLELAVAGAGIAWLPRSACRPHLQSGALLMLDESFGIAPMSIVSARIITPRPHVADAVWNQLNVFSASGRQLL